MEAAGALHGPEISAAESLTRIAKHELPHVCTQCKIVATVIDSNPEHYGTDAEHLGMFGKVRLAIAKEVTGNRRARVFGYSRYLKILSGGREPLKG